MSRKKARVRVTPHPSHGFRLEKEVCRITHGHPTGYLTWAYQGWYPTKPLADKAAVDLCRKL